MYSILFLFLFIGIVMIVDGIYKEEIVKLKNEKKIEYKFIPRTMYDDMLFYKHTTPQYENIFTEQHDSRGAGRVV
ncbi:hypothetical protein QKU58_gp015 [Pyramimonas orientalis virus]|uniref:Uncharacterized protein n=1 Tax=Pyramimonas orientalis virus 01B TaxID=3134525 RepID=A0A7M4CEP9_9VIRU|nr:hypothetical protein QKU58_gp015 [Pyramimonas orientalis virus]QOI90153.1 hypothetical protein HWQ62_00015 [Pyramimonas orientalis virus]